MTEYIIIFIFISPSSDTKTNWKENKMTLSALSDYTVMEVPLLLGGFIYEMTTSNHLVELQ